MKRVLFVCTGNICRSPTAEGVARHFIETGGLQHLVDVDSAATQGYHVGEPPDPRAVQAAARRGYDLSGLRARKLIPQDYQRFDLLLGMDHGHLKIMKAACPEVYRPRLDLFLRFAPESEFDEVPDPYYGGAQGFDLVLDLCERAVAGLLDHLAHAR